MKRLFRILCLLGLLAPGMARAQLVTATLTITNAPSPFNNPTNGYTLTVNGVVLTWTNVPNSTAQYIPNTNNVGQELTNLFNTLSLAAIANVQQVYYTGTNTNSLAIVGISLTALASLSPSNWCYISSNTVPTTNTQAYVVYPPTAVASASEATNMYSNVAAGLDTWSTTPFGPYDLLVSNYFSLTATNTITGPNTFTGKTTLTNTGNYITGGIITNVTLQQVGGSLSNNTIVNPVMTNGQNFGNPFRSPGGGTGSEQFGLNALANANGSSAFGDGATAGGINSVAIGFSSLATSNSALAFGAGANAGNLNTIAFNGTAANQNSIAIGALSDAAFDFSVALGYFSTPTTDHQIRIGTSSFSVSIPGNLEVDGVISNAIFSGSLTLQNELIEKQTSTTLTAGNNADVATSTNVIVYLTGPASAFTNVGFAGGTAGRFITVIATNGAVAPIVFSNEDGLDTVATNRLRIGPGVNNPAYVSSTNSPSVSQWWYDGNINRWILISIR